MHEYEKLGLFYLGKEFDPVVGSLKDDLILYDARDLTTHAMIVGMTGSGKTGLALALLEEAAIDNIPSILIDPKGDLGNILLLFPELEAADFRPWIDESEAARKGMDPEAFAVNTAQTWKNGLAAWGQAPDRIRRLKETIDMAVYTPGNSAGRPLQILRSFVAPGQAIVQDASAFSDQITAAVSGLLGLLGIDGDPIQSREHILLSNIFDRNWREGKNLDLATIIYEVQKPSFDKLGVFDLELFYPAQERVKLAMRLNSLLASPGFSAWLEGEPLDIQRLFYTPEGKPRVSVLSIAHLSDSERMFFVTILLNEVVSWMRTHSGTSSLRALLYMDEIFGYFPPVGNPPSKRPMLTLLKQARAFGLGVVLSTQNPVDLDYKGLSNCGTWFIGRLQTDRDKMRVIEGLENAAAGGFDRAQLERILSGLGSRTFLMRNVHEDEQVIFQTRWVMSYLRGPLTLPQIQTLSAKKETPADHTTPETSASVPVTDRGAAYEKTRPVLSPDVPEYFLHPRDTSNDVIYRPVAIGPVRLHFVDAKSGIDHWQTRTLLAPLSDDGRDAYWEKTETFDDLSAVLDKHPAENTRFGEVPAGATHAKNIDAWKKALSMHVYQHVTLFLLKSPETNLISKPDETEGDFRTCVIQALRERRDGEVEKLTATYTPKLQVLKDRLNRALERLEREKAQVGQQKLNTTLSVGATLLGAFLGRGRRTSTISRTTTAARSMGRISKETADVERANENVEDLQERLASLQEQFDREVTALKVDLDPQKLKLQPYEIRPRKSDITLGDVGLCWVPWIKDSRGIEVPAVQPIE